MIFCPCDQSMSLGEVQGLGLGKELNYSDQAYIRTGRKGLGEPAPVGA